MLGRGSGATVHPTPLCFVFPVPSQRLYPEPSSTFCHSRVQSHPTQPRGQKRFAPGEFRSEQPGWGVGGARVPFLDVEGALGPDLLQGDCGERSEVDTCVAAVDRPCHNAGHP